MEAEAAAAVQQDSDAASPGAIAQEAGMSKRQLKRKQKMERQEENKRQRKEHEKEQKQKASELKKAEIAKMLEGMTQEDREQWVQQQREKRQQTMAARQATKTRQQQALSAPQKIVIDLDFPNLMNPSELKSLCQQLAYSYNAAVQGEQQLHLHLLGASGDVQAAIQQRIQGRPHWAVTYSEQPHHQYFKHCFGNLVYLTADSPDELEQLDTNKIYIIGGIVDRNRHKGICYKRAQGAGMATAKLPIAKHVKLQTSAVITVNQVVDILARVSANGDWKTALEQVLPCRKRQEVDGQVTAPQAAESPAAQQAATQSPPAAAIAADARAATTAAGTSTVAQEGVVNSVESAEAAQAIG